MSWAGYVTVLADPAWIYHDKLRMEGKIRSSVDQYKSTMTVTEICALYSPSKLLYMAEPIKGGRGVGAFSLPKIKHHDIASTGFLWCWATATTLLDGSAVRVCESWGYRPVQIVPWVKGRVAIEQPRDGCHLPEAALILNMGMGRTTRVVTEFLIVCVRGEGYTKLVKRKNANGLIVDYGEDLLLESRTGHSKKPRAQYDLIESLTPGPYLELYAKDRREGWTSDGDELPPAPTPDFEWP